jgi:hypothetical protein
MRFSLSYKLSMKRAKALLFRESEQSGNVTQVSAANVSKILISLIVANLFCAIVLYLVFLIF